MCWGEWQNYIIIWGLNWKRRWNVAKLRSRPNAKFLDLFLLLGSYAAFCFALTIHYILTCLLLTGRHANDADVTSVPFLVACSNIDIQMIWCWSVYVSCRYCSAGNGSRASLSTPALWMPTTWKRTLPSSTFRWLQPRWIAWPMSTQNLCTPKAVRTQLYFHRKRLASLRIKLCINLLIL